MQNDHVLREHMANMDHFGNCSLCFDQLVMYKVQNQQVIKHLCD